MMRLFKILYTYFFVPKGLHCKPIIRKHEWRAPLESEQFPHCMYCNQPCWWMRGYYLNSGTYLRPDQEALALIDQNDERLRNIPWDSRLDRR